MIKTRVLMKYRSKAQWRMKYVTLESVAESIRKGEYMDRVNAVRGLDLVKTEIGMASGEVAAEWLPVVMPAKGAPDADAMGKTPQPGTQDAYTGLVLLSLPVLTGLDDMERLRQTVNQWPQTLLSFVGATGQTLYVVIPYELTDGSLPVSAEQTSLFQQHAFRRAAAYVQNATGIRPEETPHDGNESFRLSYDEAVYLNPAVQPIRMEQPVMLQTEEPSEVAQTADVPLDTQMLPGYTRREMDVVKYNAVSRQLAFGKSRQLEDHLMQLAVECRKAGIDQELATKMTVRALDCLDKEVLVRSTFQTAYEKHKLGLRNPVGKSMMHQQLLEEFLKRRYMFRRNSVTGDVEVQEKYMYELWWKPLTPEVLNDIHSAAISEGIEVWLKDLERVFVSEHTDTYDPVREWLDALPQWDGRDRLGELAARVPTSSPCWTDDFKVWMRSMVSQWRSGANALYGAQMVLMLVGGQGTRKSTFMRMLLPRELMPFYIDRIDFANKKEALRALSRFLLINIDEYDQVSKTQTPFLKHLIQRTDVKERKLYSTTFEQQQRYAAFCATTNSLVPLKDETGARRYLVVEVSGIIDTDTQGDKRIDYPQLYAQIVAEIARGEDYAFTGERERRIMEQNADYYETPNVISLFEDRFRKPEKGDEVLLLSPTEMLQQLKMDPKNRSNATLLGGYLHRKGFERGSGADRRRYKVARCGGGEKPS